MSVGKEGFQLLLALPVEAAERRVSSEMKGLKEALEPMSIRCKFYEAG